MKFKDLIKRIMKVLRNPSLIDELKEELLNQKKLISGRIEEMLDLTISKNSNLEVEEIYNRLKFIDPEGWCIYGASKEILNIDVYREFVVEDTMGRFEESDGHELKVFIEAVVFGDCTYISVGGINEVLDTHTIDDNSKEYKNYLDKLYPLVVHKLVEELYKEEPEVKLDFLKKEMESLSQENRSLDNFLETDNKENDEFIENEDEEVYDEELEM